MHLKLPDRVIPVLLVALGVAATVLAFLALFAAGIGVDTPIHAQAAIQVREIPDGVSLQQAYDAVWGDQEFYGILVQQLADGLHTALGGGTGYLEPGSLSTYRWEGAVNILIAVMGAAGLAVALGAATRSFLAGAFAWAALMTIPLYLGMSHVDFKDMPIAAGLTLVSASFMLARRPSASWNPVVGYAVLGGGGAFLAVGARTGAWPLVAVLMGACLAIFVVQDARGRRVRAAGRTLAVAAGSVLVALGLLWSTNPIGRIDMLQWLTDSASRASQYPTQDVIRTAGVPVSSGDIPWWYVPAWLVAQLPILVTVAVVAGLVFLLAGLAGSRWSIGRPEALTLTPLLVQGILLPLLVVGAGAILYDGIRHVLFIVPALAGIAAVAVAALERGQSSVVPTRIPVVAITALIVALVSLFASVRWYPYMYAYVNPIAGLQKDPPAWALDYWGVSRKEGVERLRSAGVEPIAAVPLEHEGSILGTKLEADIRKDPKAVEFGVYQFHRYAQALPPSCRTLFTITRDGLPLGSGGVCPLREP